MAEIVTKHLRSTQLQMLDARDIYLQPKSVLDAVINFVKSFIQSLEEKDNFNEPKTRKATLAVLSFMLPFLVCRLFFSFSGSQSSFNGAIPPPTWKIFAIWLIDKTQLAPHISAVHISFLKYCWKLNFLGFWYALGFSWMLHDYIVIKLRDLITAVRRIMRTITFVGVTGSRELKDLSIIDVWFLFGNKSNVH